MKKILLIDDDPDMRQVVGSMLLKEGFEVDMAASREEALQLLEISKPAVILLDVLLSGSDGRDLCRDIKNNTAVQDIPIIMLSGHPGAAAKIESYGANDFLAKPFTSAALLEKLGFQLG